MGFVVVSKPLCYSVRRFVNGIPDGEVARYKTEAQANAICELLRNRHKSEKSTKYVVGTVRYMR